MTRRRAAGACGVAVFIVLWQALAFCFSGGLVLASPLETLKALARLSMTGLFWERLCVSAGRIGLGFLLSMGTAAVAAVVSFHVPAFETVLAPFVSLMKSVPLAVTAILLLILFSSGGLSPVVVLLVSFPIFYGAVLTGARSADRELLEMARVFRWSEGKKWRWLRLPASEEHLRNAVRLASGMAWKAGISAEVIGTPPGSIGEALYSAKIYLATEELFAWAAAVLLLGWLMERASLLALDIFYRAALK